MRKINKKAAVVAGGMAVAVVGAGIGYGYWTDGGSGTGTASVGTTSSNITVTATQTTGGATALVPGGAAANLALSASNPNSYTTQLDGKSLTLTGAKCGSTDVATAWFSLPQNVIHSTTQVPGGTVASPGTANLALNQNASPVQVQMENSSADQDVCKSSTVTFTFSVA